MEEETWLGAGMSFQRWKLNTEIGGGQKQSAKLTQQPDKAESVASLFYYRDCQSPPSLLP
jgi:hypothetical protein